jgi:hypothetical protein
MKIRPVGAELFHVDRQTDGLTGMRKPKVAYHNFVKTPEIILSAHTALLIVLYGP